MPSKVGSKTDMKQTAPLANQTELCLDKIPSPEIEHSRLTGFIQPSEPQSRRNSSRPHARKSVDVSMDLIAQARKPSVISPHSPSPELTEALIKLKSLSDEAGLLSMEHLFIDQTMNQLNADSEWQSIESKELFLLSICERYLKQSAVYLQDARKDKSTPLIEAIENQNELICEAIREKSNQRCLRKWNDIKLSSVLKEEEVRTLNLQLERITSFKQTLQTGHEEFIADNQLYLEFLDKYARKTEEEIAMMTADDVNRAQIIAQTLLADCQGKLLGDLSEIKESNNFLQSHLKEFEKDSKGKLEQISAFEQLKGQLVSGSRISDTPLTDEIAELNDQITEIQQIESRYSLKDSEVKRIFSHINEKMNRETVRIPSILAHGTNPHNQTAVNDSADTLATLYKLYEMRDQVERDLESQLAALAKEEHELNGVTRVFNDLTMYPSRPGKLTSIHSPTGESPIDDSTGRINPRQSPITNCIKP
jgi:hypothetical protein